MLEGDTTAHNVRRATTRALLHMRARTVRAQYERFWNVLNDNRRTPFVWSTPEKEGTDAENEELLREYILSHVARIQRIRSDIERS